MAWDIKNTIICTFNTILCTSNEKQDQEFFSQAFLLFPSKTVTYEWVCTQELVEVCTWKSYVPQKSKYLYLTIFCLDSFCEYHDLTYYSLSVKHS